MDASAAVQSPALADVGYGVQSVSYQLQHNDPQIVPISPASLERLAEPGIAGAGTQTPGGTSEGEFGGFNVQDTGLTPEPAVDQSAAQGGADRQAVQPAQGTESQAVNPQGKQEEQDPIEGTSQNEKADKNQEMAQQQELARLKARDQEVKSHERAHAAVGGHYAGSPSYEYERGSDGKRYAVSGEVEIDISTIPGDPQATLIKMQKVYAAAMAPVNPSMADIRVASEALKKINLAKQELTAQRQEQIQASQQTLLQAESAIEETPAIEARQAALGESLDEQGRIRQEQETNSAFVVPQPDSQRDKDISSNQRLSPDAVGTNFAQGTVITPPSATLESEAVNSTDKSDHQLKADSDSGLFTASQLQEVKMAIEKRYGIAPKPRRVA